jgi:hypothetical protein
MQSGGGIGGAAVQEGQLSVGVQVRITFNIQ